MPSTDAQREWARLRKHAKSAKPHKYGAKAMTVDGIRFASKKEAKRYQELKILEKAGKIAVLSCQPRYDFPPGFSYVADFRYMVRHTELWVVEDVKGIQTPVFKLKAKCMAYFYPHVKLVII